MGVTQFSLDLIKEHGTGGKMLEYGAQNTYFAPFITGGNHYYWNKDSMIGLGYDHTSVDLNELHGALPVDLSVDAKFKPEYDIVTDFGTSEHVTDLYHAIRNAYQACKVGGIVIHENPKTGNWQDHGIHYFCEDFYRGLVKLCGYELIQLGENGAHGNTETGMNIHAVLKKTTNKKFPTREKFEKLPIHSK